MCVCVCVCVYTFIIFFEKQFAHIKEAWSIFMDFFSFKLYEILVSKESPGIFLTTFCEFYSWNACHLEDICENMANYGNIFKLKQ